MTLQHVLFTIFKKNNKKININSVILYITALYPCSLIYRHW